MKSKARFILSKSRLLEQYNKMEKISDHVSYSFKTNKEVGKILEKETSCMFSVHSLASVDELKDNSKIWYFAQAWTKEDIRTLFEKKVCNFVVDNENDLNMLLNIIEDKKIKINLLLRMRLKEHTVHTGKHFVYGMYSSKINELLPLLRQNKHISKLGIHFHRKTQNISEWSLKQELEDSIIEWDKIDLVNIGGGLPAEYKNFRPEVINSIFDKITELKTWLNSKNIKMIIEPGRFIAAPCIKLETTIVNIYDNNIIVDCSIFNAALDTWISNIRLLVEYEKEKGEAYTIKGITPDSADILRYRVYLEKPRVGDKLVFLNAGAYNFSTDFMKGEDKNLLPLK